MKSSISRTQMLQSWQERCRKTKQSIPNSSGTFSYLLYLMCFLPLADFPGSVIYLCKLSPRHFFNNILQNILFFLLFEGNTCSPPGSGPGTALKNHFWSCLRKTIRDAKDESTHWPSCRTFAFEKLIRKFGEVVGETWSNSLVQFNRK